MAEIEREEILVVIPTYGGIPGVVLPFFLNLVAKTKELAPSIQLDFFVVIRCWLPLAYKRIRERFLRSNNKWILFLEDDTCPPPDALIKLKLRDLLAVSALFFRRDPPYTPHIYYYNEKEDSYYSSEDYPRNTLVKCDMTGMGFSLFKREAFLSLNDEDFLGWKGSTPDTSLWRALKKNGIDCYIDTSVICLHLQSQGKLIGEDEKEFFKWKVQERSTWVADVKRD